MITMTNGVTATETFKKQLNDLMLEVFGFSFQKWHELNLWNQDYESYSIIEEGIMIANASVYKMKLLINGEEKEYLQFGAVATQKQHQGKGLAKKIMEHVLETYSNTPAFLFANDSVLDFYPRFGFKMVVDQQPYIKYNLEKQKEMIKLEVTNPKVDEYLKGRNQFSNRFDCTNQYPVNWFHFIFDYYNNLYEIPELNTLVVARQFNNVLSIYDILSKEKINFFDLVPHLHFEGVDTIQFGFNPDWLDFDYFMKDYKLEDTTLFVRGDFSVEEGYIVPRLIRT